MEKTLPSYLTDGTVYEFTFTLLISTKKHQNCRHVWSDEMLSVVYIK